MLAAWHFVVWKVNTLEGALYSDSITCVRQQFSVGSLKQMQVRDTVTCPFTSSSKYTQTLSPDINSL